MIHILYFLISLAATAIGALTGMGGGVIIKPALDALGGLDAANIGILSSVTVFTMSLVSTAKQARQKAEINLKMAIPLAAGSLLGGVAGERMLTVIIEAANANSTVVIVQNSCLALIIIIIFIYMGKEKRCPSLNLQGILPALLAGVLLGTISSFLGIGGGPINVALIIFLFGCGIKTAAVCSIITILFAQASKLAFVLVSGAFFSHDLTMLPFMVVGAVIGGWAGSQLNKTLPEKTVEKVFNNVQVLVFLICMYNIFQNLIL